MPALAPVFKRTALPPQFCNLERLFDTLERRGLDGVVAYLRPNVFYLSGFAPPSNQSVHETNGYAAVVISRHAPDDPIIIVAEFDLMYLRHQPTWIHDVRPYATLLLPFDIPVGQAPLERFVPAVERSAEWFLRARDRYAPSLVDGVQTALSDLGLEHARVGFDDLRLARTLQMQEAVDAYGTLKYVRQVKTAQEIELLKTATRLNQLAIERTIATWSRGTTWQELVHTYNVTATQLGGFVRDPGAIVIANPVGVDPALYMYSALDSEDFVVEPGMHIMWDCHGTWQHYCWDGGKTWVVDDAPRGNSRSIGEATAAAMDALQSAMRPGVRLSQLQAEGRRAFRLGGLTQEHADGTFIFFHGLGLEHIDIEVTSSHQDWALEDGTVVSAHLQVTGGDRERGWLEEIFLVTPAGGEPFFSWDHAPIAGDAIV
ncbi:MAG: M24 family metallopeptidase [Chloroflexi bacterium]|nr:M24 family metallopeptidase [Chloroflexota bacterium]